MSDGNDKTLKANHYVEYFKMIQRIIDRMARNSFLLKGWLVTIFAAVIVLKITDYSPYISGAVIIITTLFWFLDSYYLQQERLFRKLWQAKVELFQKTYPENVKLFDLNVDPFKKKNIFCRRSGSSNSVSRIPRIMISVSEIWFYLPVIVINLILFIYHLIFP